MRTYNQEEQWLLTEKFNNLESEAFQADLVLLHTGTPLAYLIGSIPFLDCVIHLDSHPLIPRTETEFWTEKAITSIRQSAQNDKNVKPDSEELVVGPFVSWIYVLVLELLVLLSPRLYLLRRLRLVKSMPHTVQP